MQTAIRYLRQWVPVFVIYSMIGCSGWYVIAHAGALLQLPTIVMTSSILIFQSVITAIYVLQTVHLIYENSIPWPTRKENHLLYQQAMIIGLGSGCVSLLILIFGVGTGTESKNTDEIINLYDFYLSFLSVCSLAMACQIVFYGVSGGFVTAARIVTEGLTLKACLIESKMCPQSLSSSSISIFGVLIVIAFAGVFFQPLAIMVMFLTGPLIYYTHLEYKKVN